MQTSAPNPSQNTTKNTQTERLSWGLAELQVTDLQRAVAFWTQAFGIHLRNQDSQRAELGTPAKTLIVLHAGATKPVAPSHTGMYHVAIGVPDQNEFSRILARLITKHVSISPTDHLASKSIYLADPDGLEIEIILETPERFGEFGDLSKGLIMYDIDGNAHSGREALDVEQELSHASGADLEAPLSAAAYLAHMHFKVPSLDAAAEWYGGLGFQLNLKLSQWGFADMGAGDGFSHRLAMNTWAGPNLKPAPDDMARLLRYTLLAHDPAVIKAAQGLQPGGTGLTGIDPAGTEITLVPAY